MNLEDRSSSEEETLPANTTTYGQTLAIPKHNDTCTERVGCPVSTCTLQEINLKKKRSPHSPATPPPHTVRPSISLGLAYGWMDAFTFIHICVDSSQTVLEHNRPSSIRNNFAKNNAHFCLYLSVYQYYTWYCTLGVECTHQISVSLLRVFMSFSHGWGLWDDLISLLTLTHKTRGKHIHLLNHTSLHGEKVTITIIYLYSVINIILCHR